jgi:hypothetical protein
VDSLRRNHDVVTLFEPIDLKDLTQLFTNPLNVIHQIDRNNGRLGFQLAHVYGELLMSVASSNLNEPLRLAIFRDHPMYAKVRLIAVQNAFGETPGKSTTA